MGKVTLVSKFMSGKRRNRTAIVAELLSSVMLNPFKKFAPKRGSMEGYRFAEFISHFGQARLVKQAPYKACVIVAGYLELDDYELMHAYETLRNRGLGSCDNYAETIRRLAGQIPTDESLPTA